MTLPRGCRFDMLTGFEGIGHTPGVLPVSEDGKEVELGKVLHQEANHYEKKVG